MTGLKYGNLSDLSKSRFSLKNYSVIVETCSGASDEKVTECAREVLSRGCRDIFFIGYDCNRWHYIFDEVDTVNFEGKALTSDLNNAQTLCLCKKKIYVLYQSRFIKNRQNLKLDEIKQYIEFFYEDCGVTLLVNDISEGEFIAVTTKIYKSNRSTASIVRLGEKMLASELDVQSIKVQAIDKETFLLNIYRR